MSVPAPRRHEGLPGEVCGGSGGWPVLVRCDIGRPWVYLVDHYAPGVLAVVAGEPLTELIVAQLAHSVRTLDADALGEGAWVDVRVLVADIAAAIEKQTSSLVRAGDRLLAGITTSQRLQGLHALQAWALTLAGGAVDDLPAGQTRSAHDWPTWRDSVTGTPRALPRPLTHVLDDAGERVLVVDAWIDMVRAEAVIVTDTPAGHVRHVEAVTTDVVLDPAPPHEERLGRVRHDTSSGKMREELSVLLDEAADGLQVDVDALVQDLVDRHGPVHIAAVPGDELWALVRRHVTGGAR